MKELLSRVVEMSQVEDRIVEHFAEVFEMLPADGLDPVPAGERT